MYEKDAKITEDCQPTDNKENIEIVHVIWDSEILHHLL